MSIRKLRIHFQGPIASGGNLLPMTTDPTVTPSSYAGNGVSNTLAAADVNGVINNTGATTTLSVALPSAASSDNKSLKVCVSVASTVLVWPATGDSIYLNGSGTANKAVSIPGTVGNYADLYCDGNQWMVVGYSGALVKTT